MNPWKTLDHAVAPDGGRLELCQRGEELVIRVGGQLLMSSRSHGSEDAMAAAGLPERAPAGTRVLVGGLGCGYTLRAVLARLPARAEVTVAELIPAVIGWNRGPLAPLAGHPLGDARVRVACTDVRRLLTPAAAWDAVLLDVDNGPSALTTRSNRSLYGPAGVAALVAALAPGGRAVIWSAAPDAAFLARLRSAGLDAETIGAAARAGGRGGRHVLFVGRRPPAAAAPRRGRGASKNIRVAGARDPLRVPKNRDGGAPAPPPTPHEGGARPFVAADGGTGRLARVRDRRRR